MNDSFTVSELMELAQKARSEYENWNKAHPTQDPVQDPYADALWNLEYAADRLRFVLGEYQLINRSYHDGQEGCV